MYMFNIRVHVQYMYTCTIYMYMYDILFITPLQVLGAYVLVFIVGLPIVVVSTVCWIIYMFVHLHNIYMYICLHIHVYTYII